MSDDRFHQSTSAKTNKAIIATKEFINVWKLYRKSSVFFFCWGRVCWPNGKTKQKIVDRIFIVIFIDCYRLKRDLTIAQK